MIVTFVPEHIVEPVAKIVGCGLTTTVKSIGLAQLPVNGENVYVVVVLKSGVGDQKPLIPFNEVFCKVNVPPAQIGAIVLNVGVTGGVV